MLEREDGLRGVEQDGFWSLSWTESLRLRTRLIARDDPGHAVFRAHVKGAGVVVEEARTAGAGEVGRERVRASAGDGGADLGMG